MIHQEQEADQTAEGQGSKYTIDIEGTLYPWNDDTITVPQVCSLGHLPLEQGVIEIDADNNQRTLAPDEVVQLRPGLGFSKKVRFKRGSEDERAY